MLSQAFAYLQYLLPQHLLSQLAGVLAEARTPWLKNYVIKSFIKAYNIDMREAAIEDPEAYACFNEFFIRQLKSGLRPIAAGSTDIACPADGAIAQLGRINKNQLMQAKNIYFDLETLLGGDAELAKSFENGSFATVYLAPNNYHRVHMPVTGTLTQTIYVPGKLFSVNAMTSAIIPNLYGRNERHISIFNTEAGPMAVILVGALIVGSIQTVWMDKPIRANHMLNDRASQPLTLIKGAELGHFKLGSTVVLLFSKDKTSWMSELQAGHTVEMGEQIGTF